MRSRNWRIRARLPLRRAACRALHVQTLWSAAHACESLLRAGSRSHEDRGTLRHFADIVEAEPGTRPSLHGSGLAKTAIEYWGRAGDLALYRSAFKASRISETSNDQKHSQAPASRSKPKAEATSLMPTR